MISRRSNHRNKHQVSDRRKEQHSATSKLHLFATRVNTILLKTSSNKEKHLRSVFTTRGSFKTHTERARIETLSSHWCSQLDSSFGRSKTAWDPERVRSNLTLPVSISLLSLVAFTEMIFSAKSLNVDVLFFNNLWKRDAFALPF